MPDKITSGTILIREDTAVPGAVRLESEPYASGWRLVLSPDGHGLGREIRAAGWTFLCQAGEIKATVFGFDEEKMVCRAVARTLANLKSEKFNSLEITRVASAASKRFLGVTDTLVSNVAASTKGDHFPWPSSGVSITEVEPFETDCLIALLHLLRICKNSASCTEILSS